VFVDGINTRDYPVSDLVTRTGLVLQNADASFSTAPWNRRSPSASRASGCPGKT